MVPSNSFRKDKNAPKFVRQLLLVVDHETELLSLEEGFSAAELRHNHEWLAYREPESHCRELGRDLYRRYAFDSDAEIGGLTWKDEGLLRSMQLIGATPHIVHARSPSLSGQIAEWDRTWVMDTVDVQEMLSNSPKHQPTRLFDFLSVRHVLEHAFSLKNFLDGLTYLLSMDAHVLIEVPDCSAAIRDGDYSILWEEHVHYFTATSLERSLRKLMWRVSSLEEMTVDGEAVLLAVVQPPSTPNAAGDDYTQSRETSRTSLNFVRGFSPCRDAVIQSLRERKRSGVSIYVLGANHVASNFIDLFGEPGLFNACLDDYPMKHGRFISAHDLPIIPLDSDFGSGEILVVSAIHPGRRAAVERRLIERGGVDLSLVHCNKLLMAAAQQGGDIRDEGSSV